MSDPPPSFVLVELEQIVHGTRIKLIPMSWLKLDGTACLYPYEDDPNKIEEWVEIKMEPQVTWGSFRIKEVLGMFSDYKDGNIIMRARQYGSRDDTRPSTSYLKKKLYDVTFMEVNTNIMPVPCGRTFDIQYKLLFKVNDENSSNGSSVHQTHSEASEGETCRMRLPITTLAEFEKIDSEMFEDPQMRETMELIFQMVTANVNQYDTALRLLLDAVMTQSVQAEFIGGAVNMENRGVRYFGNTITSDLIEDFVINRYNMSNDNYELTDILEELITEARQTLNQQ
ncbi:hypothetical protein WA026_018276 [Henosepilachna vigintioctopunctata]|uniref:Uncharacterized protein n=1 Tax=Henosepilachna vigintioctopunctata TaxID=420089 RepID=A0AAW1V8N7_9CUCU